MSSLLETLANVVKDNTGDAIVNNNVIPNQFNEEVIGETSHQIVSGLKGQFEAGNIGGLMGLLNSDGHSILSNPIVTQIVSSLAGALASKFGVSEQLAGSTAGNIIAAVLPKLLNKINDPNDNSIDLASIAKEFGGGGLGGMLGGMLGGGLGKLFG